MTFLKSILQSKITNLLTTNPCLEIDPSKITTAKTEAERMEIVEKNKQNLLFWIDDIIDAIANPENLKIIPQELRIVSCFIAHYADSQKLNTSALVFFFSIFCFFLKNY